MNPVDIRSPMTCFERLPYHGDVQMHQNGSLKRCNRQTHSKHAVRDTHFGHFDHTRRSHRRVSRALRARRSAAPLARRQAHDTRSTRPEGTHTHQAAPGNSAVGRHILAAGAAAALLAAERGWPPPLLSPPLSFLRCARTSSGQPGLPSTPLPGHVRALQRSCRLSRRSESPPAARRRLRDTARG